MQRNHHVKIGKLDVTNVKGIVRATIQPGDSPVVLITGANGQGKSSLLDAIWLALGGRKAANANPRAVRDGSETAEVRIEIEGDDDGEGLVVVRRWIDGETSLQVRDERGFRATATQSALDALVGAMTFDPLEWLRKPEREQRQQLLQVVDLPFDLDELARRHQAAFDARTVVNREVQALEARVAGMPTPPPGLPDTEVSIQELLAQLEAAEALESRRMAAWSQVEAARGREHDLGEQIKRAERELAAMREALAVAGADLTTAKQVHDDLPAGVDTSAIKQRLSSAEDINAAVRAADVRKATIADLERVQREAAEHTATLARIDTEKRAGLSEAKMPLAGMEVTDDGVEFQGRPLRQCSTSEQIRVSVATAMAGNPTLRLVRIANGNDLDTAGLQLVTDLAREHDFQAWIELVDETGERGFHIVAGEVDSSPHDR